MKKLIQQITRSIRQGFKRAWEDIRNKKYYSVALVVIFILLTYFVSITAGIFWLLFLSFAVFNWENRIIGVLALLSLVTCPILLSLHKDTLAEQMAVYAYYFLVITVVLQIIEYKRSSDKI